MADTLSPALKKFDERLGFLDGTEIFPDQDTKTTHAEQRAVLTPWSEGCASENLDVDYGNFVRYSFGDAWETGTIPFTKFEYTTYLKMIEKRSGVSLLWTEGACKMKKSGAAYLIIVAGGDDSGKTTTVGGSTVKQRKSAPGSDRDTPVPTDIEIFNDDAEVGDVQLDEIDGLDEAGFDDPLLTLNTQEHFLELAEKTDSVVYKYNCGERQITATTTDAELEQEIENISCK